MAKLRKSITLETTFATYTVDEQIGNGGAGTVYGGVDSSNVAIAVKVLSKEARSTDKRRRFKNEIAFLAKCTHRNVVQIVDHGVSTDDVISGPFYVMKRYTSSLRAVMKGLPPQNVLPIYLQVLDGVEAAHFLGAIHRDLKPENVLWNADSRAVAVADFGVASLTPELAATAVETREDRRLANFIYAAPEQRLPGGKVTAAADIYALGMMLNEMFTGDLALGQGYKKIQSVAPAFAYLDEIVAVMLSQSHSDRPKTIAQIKSDIERLGQLEVIRQKVSEIDGTVVPVGEIDNPLALDPPCIASAEYQDGWIIIGLDRPVNDAWVDVLKYHLGSYSSIIPPNMFNFSGRTVRVEAPSDRAEGIVNLFRQWLPQATSVLNNRLKQQHAREQAARETQLRQERTREAERLASNRPLKF